ncbi:MAG: hypothetical protein LBT73_01505 [Tannerellaceae bacterium]|jgi:hypothetical protein|nr:hypothetical protein [Tannerellaceae bacterium]
MLSGIGHARSWFVIPNTGAYGFGDTWATAISLQDALYWCSTGDTIYLKTGNYSLPSSGEHYTIFKKDNLSLIGGFTGNADAPLERSPLFILGSEQEDMARSRISAQSQNRIFFLDSVSDIFFKDLVLSNGLAQPLTSDDAFKAGGAVYMANAENITFQDVSFLNNTAQSRQATSLLNAHGYGGAVFALNTSANFIRCKFSGNCARTWITPTPSPSTHSDFAGKGGAIYAYLDNPTDSVVVQHSILIDDCRFINNYATGTSRNISAVSQGGAVWLGADSENGYSRLELRINNSEFYGNKAIYGENLAGNSAAGGAIYQMGDYSWLTLGHHNRIYNNDNGLVVSEDPTRFHFEKDEEGVHWGFIRDNYTTSDNIYPGSLEESGVWPDYTYSVRFPEGKLEQAGFILGTRDEHPANFNAHGAYEVPREATLGIRLLRNKANGTVPALVFTNPDGSLKYTPPSRTLPDLANDDRQYVEYRYQSTVHNATLSGAIPFTSLSIPVHDTTLLQHEALYLSYTISPEEIVSVTRRSTLPEYVSFNNDGLVQALKPTPNGSPALLITSVFTNGTLISADTCKVAVLPPPFTSTPDKAYNYMPVLTDGASGNFRFTDIAKRTLCDLRPEAGYASRNGFKFSVIKPNVDIHQLRTYGDDYLLHVALRTPNTPGYFYRICISDGSGTDTCIVADHRPLNEYGTPIADPNYILPSDGQWHSLFIPLKRNFPLFFTDNVSLASGTPFLSITGLNDFDPIAVDGISFLTAKDLITSISFSPPFFFMNAGDMQTATLSYTPSDLAPPALFLTNPALFRISGPYGYQPEAGGTHRYTVFARSNGAGQLTLPQDPHRLLVPVIVSPAETHNPLAGNSYYLFYAGQETADRFHADGLVTADLRPNAEGLPTTLIMDEATILPIIPPAATDTNSTGDTEDWLRFQTPADIVSGVKFRSGNIQSVLLSTLANDRHNAFFHIAYRLENDADVDRPTHPLIELTFTLSDGRTICLPIGQDYLGTNGVLPMADFNRRKGWTSLDIPLSLPIFDAFFEGNPSFGANADILRITAKDPDSEKLYTETHLDAIFFYRREFFPLQSVELALAPHENLQKVGNDFIFTPDKDWLDLIVNFYPANASNKRIDRIYDPTLAKFEQSDPLSLTSFTFRPLVADTVVSLQLRSKDGNHLSNILSIRIPSVKPRAISLKATAVSPVDASTEVLNYNEVISLSVSFDPPYTDDTDIIWTLSENGQQTLGIPAAEFLSVGGNSYAPQRFVRALLKDGKITVTAQSRNAPNVSASFSCATQGDDPSESPQNSKIVPLDDTTPIYGNTLSFRIDALPAYTTHRYAQWTLASHPVNYNTYRLDDKVARITNPTTAAAPICGVRINTPIDTTFYVFARPVKPDGSPYTGLEWLTSFPVHIKPYLPTSFQLNEHYKISAVKDTFHLIVPASSLSWPKGAPENGSSKSPYTWSIEPPDIIKQVLPDMSTYTDPIATFTTTRAGVDARIILSLRDDPSVADTCIVSVPITSSITDYVVTHNNIATASNYTLGDTFLLHTQIQPENVLPAGFEWTFYPPQSVEIIQTFPPFHDSIRIRPLLSKAIIATAYTAGSMRYAASHTLTPVLPAGQSLVIKDAYGHQQAEVFMGDELSLTADFAPNHALRWEILSIADGAQSTAAIFTDSYPNAYTRTLRADKSNETIYITATATDVPDTPCGIFRLVIKRKPLTSLRIGRPDKPLADSSHVFYRKTATLRAFVDPALNDPHPLVWSISPKGIAEFVGENDADPFTYTRTVRAITSNASCMVTVQTADGERIAHHTIFVPSVPLDSFSLINPLTSQSILSLVKEVGDTIFLSAELFPAEGIYSTVRWTLEPLGVARFVKTTASSPLECAVKILKPNCNVTVNLAVDNLSPASHAITFSSVQNVTLQRVNGTSLRTSSTDDPVVVLQAVPQPPEANLANLQWSIEPPTAASFVGGSETSAILRTVRINDTKGQEAFVRVTDPRTSVSATFPLHNTTLVSSISLRADATHISHGTEVRLYATILPEGANQSIVWKARNLKTLQELPIIAYPDETSLSAVLGIAEPNQQVLVTATAADGSGRVASSLITSKPVAFESLKLVRMDNNGIPQQGTTADVHTGDTLLIWADVYPASAAPNGLIWNINPLHAARFLDAAPVGAPSKTGVRKVEIRSAGEVRISAVHPSDLNGSKAANFTLNATPPPVEPKPPVDPVKVTNILLIDENQNNKAEVSRGATITLSTILYPKEVAVQSVKWTIDPASAVDGTASSPTALTRTFTALTPNTTLTITVSTIDGEPKSSTYTLHILPLPVTSISLQNISPDEGFGFAPGRPVTIQATILPIDATDRRLQWTVSPADVAEYDPTVTAAAVTFTPLFHDTTFVITAAALDGSALTASLAVTTTAATPPTAISTPLTTFPAVDYHHGYLRLLNLDGYLCRLSSLTGNTLALFRPFAPTYLLHHPLSSGVYLLSIQKGADTSTLKFLVK